MRSRRQPAFTMVEILVVLVILVVSASLIVPRMGRSVEGGELREAAGRFAHTARTVRELAISTQKTTVMAIDLDRGTYSIMMQSDKMGGEQTREVQASWLKWGRWPEAVRHTEYRTPSGSLTTSGLQRLEFFSDGTSSGASIRLVGTDNDYAIMVHPQTGRVVCGDAGATLFESEQYDLGD